MSIVEQALGAPIVRVDGREKVTGSARYAAEYPIEDVAYAWPVGATIARGRVTAVEATAALADPAVLAVLDAAGAPRLEPGVDEDLMVLQSADVAYHGQIVAAVVATSLEAARSGAAAVRIAYEQEQHDVVLRADDARAYVPQQVNDTTPGLVERGDVDRALADAPVRFAATYTTPAEHASPMEPHATIAVWADSRLTLYNADQGPYLTAARIAALFGLAPEAVEIVAEHVGGGFGSKAAPHPPAILAALAAQVVGRPVKVALTRPQMFSLVTYRTPTIQRVELGAERDGRLTAIVHDAVQQSSTLAEYTEQTVSSSRLMYAAPNVRTTARLVRLDVPTPGWFRAPGHTPGMFALESAIDELAVELGVDPVELRIRNEPLVDPDSGEAFSSRGLVPCLREGATRFGWESRDPTPAVRREGRWLVGTGVAASTHPDYTAPSTATARAEADGTFVVRVGAVDIGTGARTALSQVAADALAVPFERVRLEIGRASLGPAPFAGGSMGTASWGWAVDKACRTLAQELDERGGVVPDEGLEVSVDTTADVLARTARSRHAFGALFAQVRVDVDTGEVRVDRLLGVFAAGRILNPRTARSQLLGAMVMGQSMALLEAAELDRRFGDFANHDLASYHVAAHADVRGLEATFLPEHDEQLNPAGGKGVGELGIVGAAAAIANAFHHATGVRVRDLPIRIERVRPGLRRIRERA
ncbi:MAG: xanthine dehydrogenase [Conexibacter sp.]|nr:xanthine dehydrogenase [Conexibacter sp.]